MSEKQTFDCWAIVEVMGHVTMAGRVTERAIGGQSFIRIDVPESGKLAGGPFNEPRPWPTPERRPCYEPPRLIPLDVLPASAADSCVVAAAE